MALAPIYNYAGTDNKAEGERRKAEMALVRGVSVIQLNRPGSLRLLFLGVGLLIVSFLWAQQHPLHNLYRENWLLINPASFSDQYLINSNTNTLALTGRYQWTALPESPATIGLQYQTVKEEQNIALGGMLIADQTGAIGNVGAYANCSYRIQLGRQPTQFLSIGFNAGVQQYRVDFHDITFANPGAASAPADNLQQLFFDFGFGAFYYFDNLFYAGVSMPQFFNVYSLASNDYDGINIDKVPHYNAVIGGYVPFGSGATFSYLEPSAWVKYVQGVPVGVNYNLRYNYRNIFWLGGGGDLAHNYHVETGFVLSGGSSRRNLFLGLGYDFNANGFSSALGHTFEINLSYGWGRARSLRCPFW